MTVDLKATAASATGEKPLRCFVVMGFGTKTDYATGRKLDLNKSYKYLIKPVVESRRVECVRADEILHSGVIDVPMYQELMNADVVVADLSSANLNAAYELGIRHALKPFTTIVISESQLPYPFDVNHIAITSYKMFEEGIEFEEVERFRKVFGEKLDAVLLNRQTDSPVYTFLSGLNPPFFAAVAAAVAEAAAEAVDAPKPVAEKKAAASNPTLIMLVDQGEKAIKGDDFVTAKVMFAQALSLIKSTQTGQADAGTGDAYLVQRLALATYKAKQPDDASRVKALNEALALLEPLNLEDSNDPETLGLAGAIEKRHFDLNQGDEHLLRSIKFYRRGYFLRNDWYNGINLAYLTNVRTDTSLDPTVADKIADLVYANRTRREVLVLCDQMMNAIRDRGRKLDVQPVAEELKTVQRASDREQSFWCLATKAEAHFGLGEVTSYEAAKAEAYSLDPPPAAWMKDSFESQIGRLNALLQKHGHLLDPPSPGAANAKVT